MKKSPAKSKRPKGTKNRFGEEAIRKAFTIAVMKRDNHGPAWTRAAREVGTSGAVVQRWSERHPELFKEVEAECGKVLEQVAPDLAVLLLENANLAAREWNRRLKDDPAGIKDFALTGILDYSIKNARLLEDKPTGIEKHQHSLVEQVIMIMAEERTRFNGNPRLKNIEN